MEPKNIRILIGEDDAIVATDMQTKLVGLGYQVDRLVKTPKEVLTAAKLMKPDAIVLDFNIKGDDHGIEVAQKLHEIANIPIVFVSAYAEDVVENAPIIPGSYRYVTKPFVLSQLHAAIQTLLAKS